jgi:hypothetical protein
LADREKLIELISGSGILCEICGESTMSYCAEALASHLLSNGVMFATDTNVGSKWISVEDRLPEKEFEEFTEQMDWDVYPCLCAAKNHVSGIRYVAKLFYDGSNFVDDEFVRYTSSVTHWMPLPEPPKED